MVFENDPTPDLTQTMVEGTARVEVMRLADETYAEQTFTIGTEDRFIKLVLAPLGHQCIA